MIKCDSWYHEKHNLFQEQKKAETLCFLLYRIYFLMLQWCQSNFMDLILIQQHYEKAKPIGLITTQKDICHVIRKDAKFHFDASLMPIIQTSPISSLKKRIVLDSWTSLVFHEVVQIQFLSGTKGPVEANIPLCKRVDNEYDFSCFYCKDIHDDAQEWKQYSTNISRIDNNLSLNFFHSGYFVLVSRKKNFVETKTITCSGGQIQYKSNNTEVCVLFPPESIKDTFLIGSIEVLGNDPFYHKESSGNRLAGPVVCLGPSGSSFHKDVYVTIPLTNGKLLQKILKKSTLTFQVSQTKAGEPPSWEPFETNYVINWTDDICSVTFRVIHFTLYKAVWGVLDVVLPDTVKIHASTHLPGLTFWTSLKVYMTDCRNKKQFGMCVVGSRDSKNHFQGLKEYPLEVGWCTPQKLKSGRLAIKLKSKLFTADEMLGESAGGLTKFIDYNGHDFDVQFLCVLNGDSAIPDVEMFGKVLVCSVDDTGNESEECSFNLIKKQHSQQICHNSLQQNEISHKMADVLSTKGHLWNKVALYLGYSPDDIQQHFSGTHRPILQILKDYTSKGGSEEEFLNIVHKVDLSSHPPNTDVKNNRTNLFNHLYGTRHIEKRDDINSAIQLRSKRSYNEAFYIDEHKQPDESELVDIAENITQCWRKIGRKLNLGERELSKITLDFNNNTESEKAYQMLMAWRERFPDQCTIGPSRDSNRISREREKPMQLFL